MRRSHVDRPVIMTLSLVVVLTSCLIWSSAGADKQSCGWLGVSLQKLTSGLREALDVPADMGALVTEVVEDSPADKAGIADGDVIIKYDGNSVDSPHRLSRLVRQTDPGSTVEIVLSRKGKEKTLEAQIGEQEEESLCRLRIKDDDEEDLLLDIDADPSVFGWPHCLDLWAGHDLWLGIQPIGLTDQLAQYFKVTDGRGVLVGEVIEDSPAQKAGFKAGDVIVKIGGDRVEDTVELRQVIGDHEKGDQVDVAIVRDGQEKKLTATLEESPRRYQLAVTKELGKLPENIKKLKIKTPSRDLLDITVEKEMVEEQMEELEKKLEELEKDLERVKEKLDLK